MSPPPSPATTETDRAEIRDRFGIDDQWPVVCEPFTQWVLQDTFAATPTLAPVPGVGLKGYKHTLIERLANPQIRDTIARLCAESSDRIPKFLLPVIRAQLTTGGEIRRSAAVVASWARYAEGTDEQGEPIEVVDRLAGRLMPAARRQREDLLAFIADQDVLGDLADDQRFVAAYTSALASLHLRGARATLESLA
jgi:mannitol 2-dehydrogenase